jgi:hypothetical protein
MPIRGCLRALVEGSTEEIYAAAVAQGTTSLGEDGAVRRITGERVT